MKKINIVLIEPEIPQNTGNISRTCACTDSALHLIKPLGFEIDDKKLKRAGLDYWDKLEITYHESYDDFIKTVQPENIYYLTTKAKKTYTDTDYTASQKPLYLVFGKETKGIDEKILKHNYDRCIRIPMTGMLRSLNLSNSVAIVLYESLRQFGFTDLNKEGKLHGEEN